MTNGRLDAYLALTLWEGGLAFAGWQNFLDGRWLFLAVNIVLLVGIAVGQALMRRRDRARGQLVERRDRTTVPDREDDRR